MVDLHTLSYCDYIINNPSLLSMWAAKIDNASILMPWDSHNIVKQRCLRNFRIFNDNKNQYLAKF